MPPIDNNLAFFIYYCSISVCFGAAPSLRSGRAMPQLAGLLGRYSLQSSNCGFQPCCRFLSLRSKKLGLAFGHCYLSLSLRPFGPAKPFIGPRLPQPLLLASPLPLSGLVMRSSAAAGGRPKALKQSEKPAGPSRPASCVA